MERARYNTELCSNPGTLLNNVKPSNFWGSHHFRQALHYRDSVGIRTQDPQLRRLLLYPTELPNRSVFAFANQWVLRSKVAAKIVIIFGFAIRLMIFLSPWYASLCLYCLSGFALGDQLADEFDAGDEEESDEGEDDG